MKLRHRTLIILALSLYGCGDPNYQSDTINNIAQLKQYAERAMRISVGLIQPTQEDFASLDVAPVINGQSQPDGVIDVGDATVLLVRAKELESTLAPSPSP